MTKKFTVRYVEEFWEDLKPPIDWYDEISKPLASKFLDQIWKAENKVCINPLAFYKTSKTGFRRILLRDFPYKIYFKIEVDVIYFIALKHTSRSNRFVGKRLKKK